MDTKGKMVGNILPTLPDYLTEKKVGFAVAKPTYTRYDSTFNPCYAGSDRHDTMLWQ
jgi:hypothetical protein